MDSLIARFPGKPDADLVICEAHGVAYQADMTAQRVPYGADYLAKVQAYEGSPIATKVHAGRLQMLRRHLKPGASLLDWGAGSGEFVRDARGAGYAAKGFDVIAETRAALAAAGAFADEPTGFDALTLWDTLEHLEAPDAVLSRVSWGAAVFVSVPIFRDLSRIRDSRHYRPGEHLYYFTAPGLIYWLALWGFRFLESSAHEIRAGRDSIGAFAFRRDIPGHREHRALFGA